VTYRDRLEPNETVRAGAFWTGPAGEPEVSVEQGLHERFRINVGDTVRFDILGQIVTARVTSIREVDWRDSCRWLHVRVPSGVLDRLPQCTSRPSRVPTTRGPGRACSVTWSPAGATSPWWTFATSW
jgi:putative ABC transport system permease protein